MTTIVRKPINDHDVRDPEPEGDGWDEAEAALAAAQRMTGGPKRIEALRKAGQLRFDADECRRAIRDQELAEKSNRPSN